jgi:hypothetical protein
MIAAMLNGNPEPEDVRKYFRTLKQAQRDIDLRPELYTHYYTRAFPKRFHERMTRGAGAPASASSLRPIRRRRSRKRSSGSDRTAFSRLEKWAPAHTKTRP